MGEGVGVTLKRQLKCVQNTSMKSFSSKKKIREGKVHIALSVLLSNSRLFRIGSDREVPKRLTVLFLCSDLPLLVSSVPKNVNTI